MPNLQDTDVHSRPTVEAGLCDLLPGAQRQDRTDRPQRSNARTDRPDHAAPLGATVSPRPARQQRSRQHRNTLATGTKGGAAWVNRRTGRYLVPMVWLPMKAPITQPRRYFLIC